VSDLQTRTIEHYRLLLKNIAGDEGLLFEWLLDSLVQPMVIEQGIDPDPELEAEIARLRAELAEARQPITELEERWGARWQELPLRKISEQIWTHDDYIAAAEKIDAWRLAGDPWPGDPNPVHDELERLRAELAQATAPLIQKSWVSDNSQAAIAETDITPEPLPSGTTHDKILALVASGVDTQIAMRERLDLSQGRINSCVGDLVFDERLVALPRNGNEAIRYALPPPRREEAQKLPPGELTDKQKVKIDALWLEHGSASKVLMYLGASGVKVATIRAYLRSRGHDVPEPMSKTDSGKMGALARDVAAARPNPRKTPKHTMESATERFTPNTKFQPTGPLPKRFLSLSEQERVGCLRMIVENRNMVLAEFGLTDPHIDQIAAAFEHIVKHGSTIQQPVAVDAFWALVKKELKGALAA
jgi:hypothetical protein